MTNTSQQAIAYAQSKVASATVIGVGDCLGFMRDCYFGAGQHAYAGTAWTAYEATTLRGTGPAPLGALHFWKGGSKGAGHVTIDIGNGNCISTDFGPFGYIGDGRARVCPVASIAAHDTLLTYVGWSRDLDGEVVVPEEEALFVQIKQANGTLSGVYQFVGDSLSPLSGPVWTQLKALGKTATVVAYNSAIGQLPKINLAAGGTASASSGASASHKHNVAVPSSILTSSTPVG